MLQRYSTLNRDMDRFFGSTFGSVIPSLVYGIVDKSTIPANFATPRLDLLVEDENVIVKAELPGLESKDIKIEVRENALLIETHVENSTDEKSNGYVIRERNVGSVSRGIKLPYSIDTESTTSTYKNGVLEITLPKKEKSSVKVIEVK